MTQNNTPICARLEVYEHILADPRHHSKDFPRAASHGAEHCSNCQEECSASFISTYSSRCLLCMGCYKSIKALVSGVQPQQPSVGNPFNVNVVQFGMPPQPAAAGAAAAAAAAAKKPAFSFGGPPSSVVDKKRPLEDGRRRRR